MSGLKSGRIYCEARLEMVREKKHYREKVRVRAGKRKGVCRLCKRDLGEHYGQGSHCPNRARERMINRMDYMDEIYGLQMPKMQKDLENRPSESKRLFNLPSKYVRRAI
jgi:hypothetical protein